MISPPMSNWAAQRRNLVFFTIMQIRKPPPAFFAHPWTPQLSQRVCKPFSVRKFALWFFCAPFFCAPSERECKFLWVHGWAHHCVCTEKGLQTFLCANAVVGPAMDVCVCVWPADQGGTHTLTRTHNFHERPLGCVGDEGMASI